MLQVTVIFFVWCVYTYILLSYAFKWPCIFYYLVYLVLFDDILKEKLEIAMYIIIVSKKHQMIQQYKKQFKKSNKKIFLMTSEILMTSAFVMMSSIWTIICPSNNMCEFLNEENQLRSYEMTNISVTIILSL